MYNKDEQGKLLKETQELLKLAESKKTSEAKKAVNRLRDVINFHDWLYYVESEPKITDFEYDTLFKFLRKLEEENPELVTEESPTQRVARGLTDTFTTVAHLIPMLSLDNSYNQDDLIDFDRRVKELTGEDQITYCVEPKFDGASIALVYENDKLVRAATRGDGVQGDDITNNAKTLRSIPLKAAFSKHGIYKVEVRGEILIAKEIFNKLNEKRVEEGERPLGNPRNAASGSLRQKDSSKVAERGLEAFLYQVAVAEDEKGNDLLVKKFDTHEGTIHLMHDLGFRTPYKIEKICKNIEQVIAFINDWEKKRDEYAYEIDGMVVKVNERRQQLAAGFTSHHPRWAIAYKFKPRQAETILEDVEFQVGRTGIITPVAKVKPVPVAGVTIKSISLFNEDVITEKDLHIGDHVLIERAGDVIPYIVGPILEKRKSGTKLIKFPDKCPVCGSKLVRSEEEAAWRCVNIDCPEQVIGRIIHFNSKDAMDIRGFGDQIVKRFYELGYIHSLADIYKLPFVELKSLEGFGEKSIEKLQTAIEASKSQPLNRLIYGLGIRYVGETTAKKLAAAIHNIDELKDWKDENLIMLEDVGPKVAAAIVDFFSRKETWELIGKLKEAGVNTISKKEKLASNKLEGKTFLFTGSLTQMTRDEAEAMVEKNGGRNLGSVSANLSYLVAGEKAGSKLAKAQKIPSVQIISEDDFLKMIND